MSGTTTAGVLREAKAVLGRNGWYQGSWYDWRQETDQVTAFECAVCLLGAVNLAHGELPDDEAGCEAFFVLADTLGVEDDNWLRVANWNDAAGRTLDEVYALLDRAIEAAEAGDAA